MKQQIHIRIAEPCHENWNSMLPAEQGRFCMSCQKQVVDFSSMTDKEILEHIATASKSICGRADNDQLNRLLVAPPEPRRIWWRHWMGLAASFLLLFSKSNAQVKHPRHPTVHTPPTQKNLPSTSIVMGTVAMVEEDKPASVELSGRVVDDKNNPIPFATVRLTGGNTAVAADSSGFFRVAVNADPAAVSVSVSSVGYEPKTISLNGENSFIKMQAPGGKLIIDMGNVLLKGQILGEVVVTGHNSNPVSIIAGGVSVCRKPSRYQKVKNSFKELAGVSEVKVYPNPVPAQGSFNISLAIKEAGRYNIQFTDASGKIVGGRQISITQNRQLESFEAGIFRSGGIYFVSVTGGQRNKVYTAQVFVQ